MKSSLLICCFSVLAGIGAQAAAIPFELRCLSNQKEVVLTMSNCTSSSNDGIAFRSCDALLGSVQVKAMYMTGVLPGMSGQSLMVTSVQPGGLAVNAVFQSESQGVRTFVGSATGISRAQTEVPVKCFLISTSASPRPGNL